MEGAAADTRNYRVNCDKLPRVVPDFQPQWTARRGARQLYEAYKRNGVTLEEFEGPRYQRVGHIRKLLADGLLGEDLRPVAG